MEENRPVQTFRDGAVGASVWLRKTRAGVFYDVTIARAWKDEESGRAGYSQTYSDYHLDPLIKVTRDAQLWIASQKANAETVVV